MKPKIMRETRNQKRKRIYAEEAARGKGAGVGRSVRKRARTKARRNRRVRAGGHPFGPCGNIGCKACNPSGH